MVRMKKISVVLCAAFAVAAVCSDASGQAAGQTQRSGRLGARQRVLDTTGVRQQTALRPTQGGMSADHHIAAMLALGNVEEVALGNFASQQSQNAQVRSFAQQMVKDHSKMLQQLQQFAPDFVSARTGAGATGGVGTTETTTRTSAAVPTESGANIQAGNTQVQVGGTATNSGRMGFDPLAVMRQISERHIASSERDLSQKQGAAFDKCYVGMQVVLHMQMLDKLQVVRNYASPQLQQGIDQGIQTTQAHLEHAKQLMAQLDPSSGGTSRSGTGRPSTQPLGNAGG